MTEPDAKTSPRPRVMLGLILGPAAALGIGRFGYSLLLPAMRAYFGWSYATAGAVNTANAAGYLLGSFLAAPLAERIGLGRAFVAGMAVTAASVGLSGTESPAVFGTAHVWFQLVMRAAAGISGAITFVTGASLISVTVPGPSRALARYFGGAGLGIVVAAVIIPPLLARGGPGAWRDGWFVLGALATLATILALPVTRLRTPVVRACDGGEPSPRTLGGLMPLLAGYFLFGLGYIAYMTFVVALLRGGGYTQRTVAVFWAVLGTGAAVGPLLWRRIIDRLRGARGLALVMGMLAAGAALPVLTLTTAASIGSAVLFGCALLAVPTAITAVTRRHVSPGALTAALGRLTAGFAAGQLAGPLVTGVLADTSGGIGFGLAVSAALLALGAVTFLAQKKGAPRDPGSMPSPDSARPAGGRPGDPEADGGGQPGRRLRVPRRWLPHRRRAAGPLGRHPPAHDPTLRSQPLRAVGPRRPKNHHPVRGEPGRRRRPGWRRGWRTALRRR
jgi:predicted MFS family arabinose efflux permease